MSNTQYDLGLELAVSHKEHGLVSRIWPTLRLCECRLDLTRLELDQAIIATQSGCDACGESGAVLRLQCKVRASRAEAHRSREKFF